MFNKFKKDKDDDKIYGDETDTFKNLGVIPSNDLSDEINELEEDNVDQNTTSNVEQDNIEPEDNPDEISPDNDTEQLDDENDTGPIIASNPLPEDHPLFLDGSKLPTIKLHMKREYDDDSEKEIVLEQIIMTIFKEHGYSVLHNVTLHGVTDQHRVVGTASYDCGLHKSVVMVDVKSYAKVDHEVSKEVVEGECNIFHDLGLDRLIIISLNKFSEDAENFAAKYHNVELWDKVRLEKAEAEKPEFINMRDSITYDIVRSKIKTKNIEKIAIKHAKKHPNIVIKKKTKMKIRSKKFVHYPYTWCKFTMPVKQKEKAGMLKSKTVIKPKQFNICVDALSKNLVTSTKDGISYKYYYYLSLNKKQHEVMLLGSKHKKVTKREMQNNIIRGDDTNKLVQLGLIKYISTQNPFVYKNLVSYPPGINSFNVISTKNTQPESKYQLYQHGDISTINEQITKIWSDIKDYTVSLIHYPIWIVTYEYVGKDDAGAFVEKQQHIAYDGITGSAIQKFPMDKYIEYKDDEEDEENDEYS